jgi:hypothetical protein
MAGEMNDERRSVANLTDRMVNGAAIALVMLSAVIVLFHLLTHYPFFDETLHVRYLWLFSSGLKPDVDFFCTYPLLGYILTFPFFRCFPESAFVLLALRVFAVVMAAIVGVFFYVRGRRTAQDGMAGLLPYLLVITAPGAGAYVVEYSIDHLATVAAFGAMLIFFNAPRSGRVALASALCVTSVVITPKYTLPLFFGMVSYLGAAVCFHHRKTVLLLAAAAFGGVAALLVIWRLFDLNHASLLASLHYSDLLQYRWHKIRGMFTGGKGCPPTLVYIGWFLVSNPVLGLAIVLGVAGWAKQLRPGTDRAMAWAGGGIVLGTLLASLIVRDFLEQYVVPMTLCLAMFVPCAFSLFASAEASRVLRLLLVLGAGTTLVVQLIVVAHEFQETPYNARANTPIHREIVGPVYTGPTICPVLLSDYEAILNIIPRNERVVAVWPYHPLFRKDLTMIVADGIPSFALALPEDDPLRKTFDPAVFHEALEKSPPALLVVSRLEQNYPPGWKAVAKDFLGRHKDLYVLMKTRSFDVDVSVRRDLVEKLNRSK